MKKFTVDEIKDSYVTDYPSCCDRDPCDAHNHSQGPIPVYISRYGELPKGYGALIAWELNETAIWTGTLGNTERVRIKSGLRTCESAPVINSALGQGRFVIEVEIKGRGIFAVSAAQLELSDRAIEAIP